MAAMIGSTDRLEWITPKEQIERLFEPLIEEITGTLESPGSLPVREVAFIVAEYAADILSNVTNWYNALNCLNLLPEKIPPLPCHIQLILGQLCPIREHEIKEDGSRYKVGDTHALYLLPACTMHEFEDRVNAYGEENVEKYGGNPFRFSYFWCVAQWNMDNSRWDNPQWILIAKDVLAGSCHKSYDKQVRMVSKLSKKAFVDYEIPTLKEAIAFAFLHKVAVAEETVFKAEEGEHRYTFTRVQETIQGRHLIVSGVTLIGLNVASSHRYVNFHVGVAPLRKLN